MAGPVLSREDQEQCMGGSPWDTWSNSGLLWVVFGARGGGTAGAEVPGLGEAQACAAWVRARGADGAGYVVLLTCWCELCGQPGGPIRATVDLVSRCATGRILRVGRARGACRVTRQKIKISV